MAGLGSFFLEIGVDSAALQRGLNNAESRLSKFGQRAEKIGTSLSLAISAPLALVGKNALQTSAQFESLEMSFGTMLRSMENGKTLMKDLQNYNLATSFQFEEVAGAGKSLLAFGFAQQQIIPQMKMIGDISAGVGINIKDLAEIYGKARVQGRLFAEDINQLTGRGIPIIAELAKQFGVSEQAVKKLTEDGKIGFNNLEQAFASMTSTGGQFFNMTANQSTTLSGLYSNLQDSITQNLRTIGDSIVKNLDLKTVIPQASKYLTDLAEGFSNLSPEAQKAILVIGGLAIVLPPLMALVGSILPAMATGFTALISPIGLAAAAVAVLSAAMLDEYMITSKMASLTKTVAQLEQEAGNLIHTQSEAVRKNTDILNDNNSTLEERKIAINNLKKISPDYFGKLDSEKIKYDDLNKAVSKYITNLKNAAKANLLKSQIDASVIEEENIIKNPSSKTSAGALVRANFDQKVLGGIQKLMGKYNDSKVDYTENVVNTVAQNAAAAIIKIRDSRKEIEAELENLLKLGYTPSVIATGNTGGGGKNGGGGKGGGEMSDAEKKALEKLAEETKQIRSTLINDIQNLEIAAIADKFKREKAEAQKNYNDDVKAKMDAIGDKKGLDDEYVKYVSARYKSLQSELRQIQRESFIVPQEIKRTMIADVMNSVEPKDRKKVTNDVMQNRLERSIMLGTKGIQSEQDRGSIGKVLGVEIDVTKWQSDSASYINAAQGIVDANVVLKDSFKNLAIDLATQMSFIVGEMITGTASMKDLSMMITSTISQELAKIARMNIIAGIGTLISTGNPLKLLGGLAAGIGSGILTGMNKNASMQTQRVNSQPSYSVTRGSNIYTANKQYETIRNF
jgi:tape measure domain-containing protein